MMSLALPSASVPPVPPSDARRRGYFVLPVGPEDRPHEIQSRFRRETGWRGFIVLSRVSGKRA